MNQTCESKFELLWIIIFSVETLVILFTNTVTIIVFWEMRFPLRKTSVVFIYLSISFILVDVGAIEELIGSILLAFLVQDTFCSRRVLFLCFY